MMIIQGYVLLRVYYTHAHIADYGIPAAGDQI